MPILPKICLWSDLHLEFQDTYPVWKNPGADILILSGDIIVAEHLYRNPTAGLEPIIQNGWYAKDAIRYRRFFDHVSNEFPIVLMVMGNHEGYGGRWERTESIIREEFARYDNMFLLEQDRMVINDVVYLGASLWTSLDKGDPVVVTSIKDMMNDYKQITQVTNGNYHKLSPYTTMSKHNETVRWLKKELAADERTTVVIGHHTPSYKSIHPRYINQTIMNHAFSSDLSELMLDNPHIKLWTGGHVHHSHRYYIGDTLITINPHGYPGEVTGFDPNRVIDLNNMPDKDTVGNDYYWTMNKN